MNKHSYSTKQLKLNNKKGYIDEKDDVTRFGKHICI